MSDEFDLDRWQEQAAPFVDDLVKIVNKHMRKLPLGAITFSMVHFLALYNQAHMNKPEDGQDYQVWLHTLVDALCEEAREKHKQGDLPSMFAPLQ